MLRLLNLVLCLVMLILAGLQAGRPDFWLWAVYFMVPAAWAFIAAFRYRLFQSVQWLGWLWVSVAAAIGLVATHWPKLPGFWRMDVWSREESARDTMGLALALGVLLVALFTAYRKR